MQLYAPSTAGELLFLHVYQELSRNSCWKGVAQALRVTGEGDKYVAYIIQHSALYICCNLISAAKSHLDIASIIRNGPWRSLDNGGRLYRLLSAAVEKSDTDIPNSVARTLLRFSEKEHGWCYICGVPLEYENTASYSYC